jgi:hypothetical protein
MTSESAPVPTGDGAETLVDLDLEALRGVLSRIDRPPRPHRRSRIGTPIGITVTRDELALARRALQHLVDAGDVPETIRLSATALDVSLQDPLACLASTSQRLPVTLDLADVATLILALRTLDRDVRADEPRSPDGRRLQPLRAKLRRATADVG